MNQLETVAERLTRHRDAGTITQLEHETIHLHEVKKLTYRQIALGLHLSVATVWDRARRGHQKMRDAERRTMAA